MNFEVDKLIIAHPHWDHLMIWAVLLLVSGMTCKKTPSADLISRNQSDQLKGLAILMVVVSHLWVHVSKQRVDLIMGGDAVALFLVLSGFGLTRSAMTKPFSTRPYVLARIRRVMIPYWLATGILVFLDYWILHRTYEVSDLGWTLMGINLTTTTRNIDYVRWYITLILFWYLVFPFALDRKHQRVRAWGLMGIGVMTFFLDYYVVNVRWTQVLAFPVGCLLGVYYHQVARFMEKIPFAALIGIGVLLLLTILLAKVYGLKMVGPYLPSIGFKCVKESLSLAMCVSLICLVYSLNRFGCTSKFLVFCGTISYELYLLHGAFLIKYNPVFGLMDEVTVWLRFLVFLTFITMLSLGFQKLTQWVAQRIR